MAHIKYKSIKLSTQTYTELKTTATQLRTRINKLIRIVLSPSPLDMPLLILIKNKGEYIPLSTIKRKCSSWKYSGSPTERLNELIQLCVIRKVGNICYTYPNRGKLTHSIVIHSGVWSKLFRIKVRFGFSTIEDTIVYLFYKNYPAIMNLKTIIERSDRKVFIHSDDIYFEESV